MIYQKTKQNPHFISQNKSTLTKKIDSKARTFRPFGDRSWQRERFGLSRRREIGDCVPIKALAPKHHRQKLSQIQKNLK
jgi:hypothetical protein